MDILKERGPEEARLQHLSSCLGAASVSSTRRIVAMGDYTLNFPLRKASPDNPILAQLVKEWYLPEICFDIMEELLFLVEG